MRLSDYLSKPINSEFRQCEGFLSEKPLKCGQLRNIDIGIVALPYYCRNCSSEISFCSEKKLSCIGISDNLISVSSVLKCPRCQTPVPIWFVVESENEIYSANPKIRILKRVERLSEFVQISCLIYGEYSVLLDKAEQAYRSELGAGAIIYLRQIFEKITTNVAKAAEIPIIKPNGHKKPFKEILETVDKQRHIIPKEFAANGYQLFGELSNIVHNSDDIELDGLKKYDALRRLVIGILDNVKNNEELNKAVDILGWNGEK